MAIYEKLECCITVDGEDLDEYDCPPDHDASVINDESFVGPVVERYIESQPDRNFVIETRVGAEFNFRKRNCLVVDYHIDGSKMEDRVFKATAMPFARPSLDFAKGKRTVINGQQTLLRYRFSKLNADGPETQTDPKTSARLGTIVVKFTRANCRPSQVSSKSSAHISKPNFSEKQSKGRTMDTFTSLDEPIEIPLVPTVNLTGHKIPTIQFVFHYRSKETLQQLGVVEIPIKERPLEDRDIATLTAEELRELVRRGKEVIQHQEDTEKLMKKQLRQARAEANLRVLDSIERPRLAPRTPEATKDADDDDDVELQIVSGRVKDRKIEIVELD